MNIIRWEKKEKIDNPHNVDARKLYSTDNAEIIHIVLNPGESLKKHITPVDAIFYVIEGKGIVEIGDEKMEVVADTLIDSPKNIPHCWYNKSKSILRFLVIKVPKPTTATKLL